MCLLKTVFFNYQLNYSLYYPPGVFVPHLPQCVTVIFNKIKNFSTSNPAAPSFEALIPVNTWTGAGRHLRPAALNQAIAAPLWPNLVTAGDANELYELQRSFKIFCEVQDDSI